MKFKFHKKAVNCLAKENDEYFLSCSDDATILRWKIKKSSVPCEFTFKLLSVFSSKPQLLSYHTAPVIQILKLENKPTLCSISEDKSMCIFSSCGDDTLPKLVKAIKMDTIMLGKFVAMEDAGGGFVLVASSETFFNGHL